MRHSHVLLSMLALILLGCPSEVRAQSRGYSPPSTGGLNPVGFPNLGPSLLPDIKLDPIGPLDGLNDRLPSTSPDLGAGSPPKSPIESKSGGDDRNRPGTVSPRPQKEVLVSAGGAGPRDIGAGGATSQSDSSGWPWWVWVIIVLVVLGIVSDRR